jgi:multiple sugar transport system permease protein
MASSTILAGAGGGFFPALARFFRASPSRTREAFWGIVFASPWLLGLVIFTLGPIIASLGLSFTEYSILSTPKFIGLDNYIKAFTEDDLLWPSIGRTLLYAVIIVPIGQLGSLLLAILLNQKLKGTSFYRTLFFMAHLVPAVAAAVLWVQLLNPRVGPINYLLGQAGLPEPGWLTSTVWALPTVIIIGLWTNIGGNRMIIFLAGLQGVPQELYEAADIDGATQWHKFWHVTLPMISPTMLFNLILGVIGALQVFNIAYVATAGGPSYATWFLALHIYRQAFEYFRMGYGSALAWIFALILLFFTWLQMKSSGSWVYYAGEK